MKTPPSPKPDPSVVPIRAGSSGTISARWVGRAQRSATRASKVWRWCRTFAVTRIRPSEARFSASCRADSKPRLPGTPRVMNRNFPRALRHLRSETRLRPRRLSKRSTSSSFRCGGSSKVWRMKSKVQPTITLRVCQLLSPFRSFLRETASFLSSPGSGCLRIVRGG